jgi:hypothetical protein
MYATAGCDEKLEMWFGHRKVSVASSHDPDNRVHMFFAPEKLHFRSGQPIRLVTNETSGPCRIENVVLLSRRPKPSPVRLEIQSPEVEVRMADGKPQAIVTWLTNRPAAGTLTCSKGSKKKRIKITEPLSAHEVVLDGLEAGAEYDFEIRLKDRTGKLDAENRGSFKTDVPAPRSKSRLSEAPILLRRAGAVPWPVSVGVPFPQGALGSLNDMSLAEQNGSPIPAQTRVLGKWSDESLRWVLADFISDGTGDYRVKFGRDVEAVEANSPIQVSSKKAGITVDTGPIKIEFPRDRSVLPGIVWLRDADGDLQQVSANTSSPAVTLIDSQGVAYISGKPDELQVEESGSERVCVKLKVPHFSRKGKKLFVSTFRVHLFRGSPLIRVLHTFENDCAEDEFTHIREMSLRADFKTGKGSEFRLGKRKAGGSSAFSVVQTHDNRYAFRRGNRVVAKGRRFEGGADISGEHAGVSLAVRDFWQNYPKGISLDAEGMNIQVCPRVKKGDYPKGGEEEDRLYYHILDGTYKLKRGVSRTHEMWFHIRPGGEPAPAHFNKCVQRPPLYSVSLETFNQSQAVTRLPSKANSPFPPYEEWVEAARTAYAEDRKESRAYGMLNFGDWFGERTYNWGNMEYDTPWCFLQEYLRGGHPDFFTWAEEAAWHLVDVDTPHCAAERQTEGGQYAHCVGHVGGYYPDGYRERAIFNGHWSISHTWVEGLFLYHLLTGDARALEGAMKTSQLLLGSSLNDYNFTNCRNCGWHLIHLSAAYRATGRRVFLNAARIIVERVLERQRESGGWDRLMVPGHCFCLPPRHRGNAGFMVGILMVGLKRFYEATGDPRVADSIVQAADYCIDTMWVPERSSFRYTCCPESSVGGSADMRILKGVATAYQFTGKKRFKDVLLAGVQSSMGGYRPRAHRGIGKGISSPMRGAPQVLVELPQTDGER